MGMRELRDRLRLPLEALPQLFGGGKMVGQDLDRDHSLEPGVARPVDLSHAARANRGDDFVRPETRAG